MTTVNDVLADCACIRTRRASRTVSRAYDEALRPVGIKATQFILLIAVEQQHHRSTQELADRLGMERTTLVRNMQLLERDGLVETQLGAKRRQAFLTERGRTMLHDALPLWREAQDQVVAALGADTWRTAKSNLEAIADVC